MFRELKILDFFQERIDIAKYCSQEQIYMFSHMLQRTLDISVGRKRQGRHGNRDKVLPTMSRHITTVGKIRKIIYSVIRGLSDLTRLLSQKILLD